MKIIGIAGKAGVGKDTAADILCKQEGFVQYRFADPIKRGICAMFGLAMSVFDDRASKEADIAWIGKSPRFLAQRVGTEFGREMVADDIWLRCAEQFIANLPKDCPGVVISDVRFENEAAWIREQGGTVIHIRRDAADAVASHVSEAGVAITIGDVRIENNSTFKHLSDALNNVIRSDVGYLADEVSRLRAQVEQLKNPSPLAPLVRPGLWPVPFTPMGPARDSLDRGAGSPLGYPYKITCGCNAQR